MDIKEILQGKVFRVFDVNKWYKRFYKELDEDKVFAVDSYLDKLVDGDILYRAKCFNVSGERICELKPKGVNNQVRLFVRRRGSSLYLLGGLVKKANARRREKGFYKIIAGRQKKLRGCLDG